MRDHRKLKAFEIADQLALAVYQRTRSFPRSEEFALKDQIRRAAVSIATNIVEGCARRTEREYLHFLDIAYGSAQELAYQLNLAGRLDLLSPNDTGDLEPRSAEVCRTLAGLIQALRPIKIAAEGRTKERSKA